MPSCVAANHPMGSLTREVAACGMYHGFLTPVGMPRRVTRRPHGSTTRNLSGFLTVRADHHDRGLLFWAGGRFVETGGERDERRGPVGGRDNPGNTPGDVKADPAFRSTAEEVEYRTGNPDQPAFPGTQTAARDRPGALKDDPTELVGHRVRLREVPVDKAVDTTRFWIRDGNARTEVTTPSGGPSVKTGSRVNISGTFEADGRAACASKATAWKWFNSRHTPHRPSLWGPAPGRLWRSTCTIRVNT